MAKRSLKDSTIYIKDGLSGTAALNLAAGLAGGETSFDVDGVAVTRTTPAGLPLGARFTIDGEALPAGSSQPVVHTITAVDDPSNTTNVTFTPAIEAGSAVVDDAAITVLPQQFEIRVGEGNLTYTEARNVEYELNRGDLESGSVTLGDDIPIEVSFAFIWEFTRSGTGETVTAEEVLKGTGAAADWVTSGTEGCEPYAVDICVEYAPVCTTSAVQEEILTLKEFRWQTLPHDLSAGQVQVTGTCKRTEAEVIRQDA